MLTVAHLFAFAALLGYASAHFQLTYPASRGFDETKEPTAPCGGFDTVGERVPFPLGAAYIKLASEHEQANVRVMISFKTNPTNISDFTNSTTGQTQAPVRDFFQVDGEDICIGVNVKSIGYQNVTEGTPATLAVQYAGGDGNLFQCADIVLLSNATIPSNVTCSNEYNVPTGTGTGGSSGTPTASSSTTSSTGGTERSISAATGASILALIGLVSSML
ncbi:SubName: Full=Uncharacterized protein {ECO:0000313/EMBL:CCA71822.1} [Serendipita indica DSM 11827]|uniref:Copper acquisition factor BIM1-like domain-containing protein n=1 Tax=Serendipita indica (strain DSM 11827) TaxID=1109443 RepID=G4TKH9_SERID|nr:SubName: Full=Uncharacterized protein {ECO:0000313/EMBL:CCA71822.1} [Serendipita indica DSM 11827]CCA71822.1 hypothetical protein PIIN_05757 [Serendipita indica DSM 11827]